MQYLIDLEYLRETERKFGPITKRCVIYRGSSVELDNGVAYVNVEDYLKAL